MVPTIDQLKVTPDASDQILLEWKVPQKSIPDVQLLEDFISQPLPTKIPIQRNKYNRLLQNYRLPNSVMDQIFVASDDISCETLYESLISTLFTPPTYSTTEDSFHGFWDAIIKKPLELFCSDLKFDRNTSKGTSTGNCRPDFIARLEGITIFRGEEKGVENLNEDPQIELVTKLDSPWAYQGVPYISLAGTAIYM